MAALRWHRREGGYMREDGEWFLLRGARMSGGNGTAWLINRRCPEEHIGRDARAAYDLRNGQILWAITLDGYADTRPGTTTETLYAHDHDAGSLAEAKHVAADIEQREAV